MQKTVNMCGRAGKAVEYKGETAYNGFTRGLAALWKHCELEHRGLRANFSMRVLGCFNGFWERQVNEAVSIGSSKADSIMNSKADFHQTPLLRVVPVVGLKQEQG